MNVYVKFSILVLALNANIFALSLGFGDTIARCNNVCKCTERIQGHVEEFRVICNGDKNQIISLTDAIFENESTPKWSKVVYIRISNFTSAEVQGSFLSKWLAYTSCSLDIWDAGNVTFPRVSPVPAKSNAISFVFAGLGIKGSSVNRLPIGIFKKRESIGLNLWNSNINYLNLMELSPDAIHYLVIKESEVKVFEGFPNSSLRMINSLTRGEAKIEIQDSKIGYISTGALVFDDYESAKTANFKIERSTVGVLKESSIILGTQINLLIRKCTLGYVEKSAIKLVENNTGFSLIEQNIIGTTNRAMKNLKCSHSLNIKENFLYSLTDTLECILGLNTELPCNESSNLFNPIHDSCKDNFLLQKNTTIRNGEQIISDKTLPNLNVDQTNQTYDENNVTSLQSISPDKSKNGNELNEVDETIQTRLFYIVVGICCVLILMVLFLTLLVLWKKNKKFKPPIRKKSKESVELYEEPCNYMVPKVPAPLKFSSSQGADSSKDGRYHIAPLNKEIININHEGENYYVPMK